ncbi:MAG: CrcB family protein, partial [Paracoccaceae bacterium]
MVYLLVACGGGIGALLRFCLVQTVAFPYGTLSVNVIGSFLMGLA